MKERAWPVYFALVCPDESISDCRNREITCSLHSNLTSGALPFVLLSEGVKKQHSPLNFEGSVMHE